MPGMPCREREQAPEEGGGGLGRGEGAGGEERQHLARGDPRRLGSREAGQRTGERGGRPGNGQGAEKPVVLLAVGEEWPAGLAERRVARDLGGHRDASREEGRLGPAAGTGGGGHAPPPGWGVREPKSGPRARGAAPIRSRTIRASSTRARLSRDLTVPSGRPRRSAISR